MDRQEILVTRYGEMMDMLACLSIDNGDAVPKKTSRNITSFQEAMKLR
jgi:hypothetical protein